MTGYNIFDIQGVALEQVQEDQPGWVPAGRWTLKGELRDGVP